jgi:hypothetical protein
LSIINIIKASKSDLLNCRPFDEILILFFLLQQWTVHHLMVNVPEPVPAESTLNLSCGSLEAKIPSANGGRQILPRQTIKIFTE